MKKHFNSELKKYRMDDDQLKIRDDHFNEIKSDHKYMFLINECKKKGENNSVKDKREVLGKVNKFIKKLLKVEIKINKS